MHEVLTNKNLTAVDLPTQGVAVFTTERRSMKNTRRQFLRNTAIAASCCRRSSSLACAAHDEVAPFRTPYKYPEARPEGYGKKGDFDERSVDDPIVFHANGAFYMLYIGWDGVGYQTGLATSKRPAALGTRTLS